MNIYEKILELQKSIDSFEKKNHAGALAYDYVSSSDVLHVFRNKMNELGLILIPSISQAAFRPNEAYGAKHNNTELWIDFTFINVEKPDETIVIHWYGQGTDSGEKGVGKALTYAEKYLILKLLHAPTDADDPDSFQGEGGTRAISSDRGDRFFDSTNDKVAAKPSPVKTTAQSKPTTNRAYNDDII